MVIILMGVAGAGKTTIGRGLAAELGWPFYDADDLHPRANVEKMRRGVPLTDEDRRPWLAALRELIAGCLARDKNAVLACSALKAEYREYLLLDERVKLVYLKGDYELIQARLRARRDHFMPPEMLASQFATLEEPADALQIDVALPLAQNLELIRNRLGI